MAREMDKKQKRERWTTHTPRALDSFGKLLVGLGKRAEQLAKEMDERHIESVRVEHWRGTKDGIAAVERFILDCEDKTKGTTPVGQALAQIEAFNSSADPRGEPRRKSAARSRESRGKSIEEEAKGR
jgi:hypothetical protein